MNSTGANLFGSTGSSASPVQKFGTPPFGNAASGTTPQNTMPTIDPFGSTSLHMKAGTTKADQFGAAGTSVSFDSVAQPLSASSQTHQFGADSALRPFENFGGSSSAEQNTFGRGDADWNAWPAGNSNQERLAETNGVRSPPVNPFTGNSTRQPDVVFLS